MSKDIHYEVKNGGGFGESAQQILSQKAKTIDISKLGYLEYVREESRTLKEDHEKYIKIIAAQALLQGIGGGQSETTLAVAPISINHNLYKSANGYRPIKPFSKTPRVENEWIQHSFITPETLKTHSIYDYSNELNRFDMNVYPPVFDIYEINKIYYNDCTVLLIYGIEINAKNNKKSVQEIEFCYKHIETPIKKIEIHNLGYQIFDKPVLYKKDDYGLIKFHFSSYNKKSKIRLLGYQCNYLGLFYV